MDTPPGLAMEFPDMRSMPAVRFALERAPQAVPLKSLECGGFPGMRMELWGPRSPGARERSVTGGCDVDALRFHLEDCAALDGWADGVREELPACGQGSCSWLDCSPRRQWRGAAAAMIVFRLPRASLMAWAQANGYPRFDGLRYRSGAGFADPVLANLALAMLRSLSDRRAAAPAFTAMIFESALPYIVTTFGAMVPEKHRGGLAGWQMRAVEQLVAGRLDSPIPLSELARICGLSVSYFVKAFRVTCGVTPHQWLIGRRVDRAQDLLRSRPMPLADVAAICGFADQSHFTRMFSKIAGVSPGVWRKQMQSSARLNGAIAS